MKIDEIRDMSEDGLLDELEDRKDSLRRLRFEKAVGQLEDTNLVRRERRIIARIKMVLRERQIARGLAAQGE